MKVLLLIVCFFLILIFPKNILAATLQTTSDKTSLSVDEELSAVISLSINTSDGTQYFLRGVFYKDGTSNYCGATWNGNSWFAGPYSTNEGWKQFLPIMVTNASWSGTLKAKIDANDTGCSDSGSYKFKIQRFTNSGSGTFDSQNEITLSVSVPTPTFTPTPSPTKTPTPTPTSKPANTQIPQKTPTSLPTQFSTLVPTKNQTAIPSSKPVLTSAKNKEVLGKVLAADTSSDATSPNPTKTPENKKSGFPLWLVFVVLGLGVLASGCGILLYQQYRKQKLEEI